MPKDNPNEAYNEWLVVARSDGDIIESRKVGRRGETWDAPELNIAPPVTRPPVPLRRLARQGRRTRHAGRVIFQLTESPPPTQNPSIVHHGLTLAEADAAAGRIRGQLKDEGIQAKINACCAGCAVVMILATVIKVMFLS